MDFGWWVIGAFAVGMGSFLAVMVYAARSKFPFEHESKSKLSE